MEIIFVLFLAIAIDLALGEFPRAIHPVVWMGKLISFLEKGGINKSPTVQLFYGLGIVVVSVSQNPNYVVGVVRDTGIGMTPEQLSHVFDEFYRTEEAKGLSFQRVMGSL